MTNGTKSQERADVVIVGSGFGRAITGDHLAASGATGLLSPVGAR
jgi:choline dehydrogenase-like flavoprotein